MALWRIKAGVLQTTDALMTTSGIAVARNQCTCSENLALWNVHF